jgi:hypothetical protein
MAAVGSETMRQAIIVAEKGTEEQKEAVRSGQSSVHKEAENFLRKGRRRSLYYKVLAGPV